MTSRDNYIEDYIAAVTKTRPINIMPLETWSTPATNYGTPENGDAKIVRRRYRGVFPNYGVNGVDFVNFTKGVPGTELTIKGDTWMNDTPSHWWSIQETAKKLEGHVLIGGLGLGLILWAIQDNPKVERVTLVESNENVLKLVLPLLPTPYYDTVPEPKIRLVSYLGDVWEYLEGDYDSAFIDIWTTGGIEEGRKTLFDQVIPMAGRLNCPMYALGFTGSDAILPGK